jgi:hypothetical protein
MHALACRCLFNINVLWGPGALALPPVTVPGTSLRSLPGSLGVIGGVSRAHPGISGLLGYASRAYSGSFGVIGRNTNSPACVSQRPCCSGAGVASIYDTTPDQTSTASQEWYGCYSDSDTGHAIGRTSNADTIISVCRSSCVSAGYRYYAIEHANHCQCYTVTTLPTASLSSSSCNCNVPDGNGGYTNDCRGAVACSRQYGCGGGHIASIYDTWQASRHTHVCMHIGVFSYAAMRKLRRWLIFVEDSMLGQTSLFAALYLKNERAIGLGASGAPPAPFVGPGSGHLEVDPLRPQAFRPWCSYLHENVHRGPEASGPRSRESINWHPPWGPSDLHFSAQVFMFF